MSQLVEVVGGSRREPDDAAGHQVGVPSERPLPGINTAITLPWRVTSSTSPRSPW